MQENFESLFIYVHAVHSDWYYPFNYEQARMTSLVLGIEQIVGLVQILDEHKQPVSVVARARICKRLMSPGINSASLWSLSPNL